MCIIIIKESGLDMPTETIIKNCNSHHDDGFGLAFWGEGMADVEIRKGGMNLHQINDIIGKVPDPKSKKIIMHFRTATEGKICAGNCHPYPISYEKKFLQATWVSTPIALAHNGVISGMPTETHSSDPEDYGFATKTTYLRPARLQEELTDTQLFIKNFLAGMADSMWNPRVLKLIQSFTSSRIVLLTPNKLVKLGVFDEDKGLYFSNTSFKSFLSPPTYQQRNTTNTRASAFEQCDLCLSFYPISNLFPFEDGWICPKCRVDIGADMIDKKKSKPNKNEPRVLQEWKVPKVLTPMTRQYPQKPTSISDPPRRHVPELKSTIRGGHHV